MRVSGEVSSRVVLQMMFTTIQAGVQRLVFGMTRERFGVEVDCRRVEGVDKYFPIRWLCETTPEMSSASKGERTRLSFAAYQWVDVFFPTFGSAYEEEVGAIIPFQSIWVTVGRGGFDVVHNAPCVSIVAA